MKLEYVFLCRWFEWNPMRIRFFLFMVFLVAHTLILGQEGVPITSKVKQKSLHRSTGMLLFRTNHYVGAISPHTQALVWTDSSLAKADFKGMREIPLTPFVIFDKKPFFDSQILSQTVKAKGKERLIVDITQGEILFNSKKLGYKAVFQTKILAKRKAILVDGIKNGKPAIGIYKFTGEKIWETFLDDTGFYKNLKGSLLQKEELLVDHYGNVFWLKQKKLIQFSASDGTILSEQNQVYDCRLDPSAKILYVYGKDFKLKKLDEETKVMGYASNSMKPIWQDTAKVKGNITELTLQKEGLVAITKRSFTVLDPKTGEMAWETQIPLPMIRKIIPIQDQYLVVQENLMLLINAQGEKVWKDPVKIAYSARENPLRFIVEGEAVLYLTPSFSNRVSLNTGEKVWKEDLVLNKTDFISRNLKLELQYFRFWDDKARKQYPVYSNGAFFLISEKMRQTPIAVDSLDLGKVIPELEIRDQGYFLQANGQYLGMSHTGEPRYHKVYKAYGNPSFWSQSFYWAKRGYDSYKATLGFVMDQVGSGVREVFLSNDLGFLTTGISSVYGSYRSYQASLDELTDINNIEVGTYLENVFLRYKKRQGHRDYIQLLSPKDKDTLHLIQIHKDTGDETILKVLPNKGYDILLDSIERLLYIFQDAEIRITSF
jgi:hypothetical protein